MKSFLYICLLSLIGCSSFSETSIKIKYVKTEIDSNHDLILRFDANKDFSQRTGNQLGSYVYCLLDKSQNLNADSFVPNFEMDALSGTIPRNDAALFNKEKKLYEYQVILMRTMQSTSKVLEDNISCKVFTSKISGGFEKSNTITIPIGILK